MNERYSTLVRALAATLVLAGGLVHLKLYYDGYQDFPNHNLGRSFLANVVGSVLIAVALMVWRHWLPIVAALGLVNASLVAYGISRTDRGIFGFNEIGFNPSPEAALALVFEIAAAAALLALLAWTPLPTSLRRTQLQAADSKLS